MSEYIVDTTDGIFNARTTGEVIRCRDCKHIVTDGEGRYVCASFRCTTTPDGYCAWGELVKGGKERTIPVASIPVVNERTCRFVYRDESYSTPDGCENDGTYYCSACGCDLPDFMQWHVDDIQAGNIDNDIDYCPNCGARVTDIDDMDPDDFQDIIQAHDNNAE